MGNKRNSALNWERENMLEEQHIVASNDLEEAIKRVRTSKIGMLITGDGAGYPIMAVNDTWSR